MSIKKGDKIKVEYEGRLKDGTVFDSSQRAGQPLEFVAGEGQVIKGFDAAVMGMKKGEEKEVTIPVKEAYGEARPHLITKVPREQMKQEVKKGMMMEISFPNGRRALGRIADVTEKEITIDFNHPLAGKDLIFKIKILEC